jgi:hypothetical protein
MPHFRHKAGDYQNDIPGRHDRYSLSGKPELDECIIIERNARFSAGIFKPYLKPIKTNRYDTN